jgi:pyruvate dehydrogenase E1 component beta subunit
MDQVVNQAVRYMSNGQVSVPMVLRLPVGASGEGAWPMHGSFYAHAGTKSGVPVPYDARLALAAIRDDGPVVFLEHKRLYGAKGGRKEKASVDLTGDVPEEEYEIPIGPAVVRRNGSDLTILANMLMVHRALAAAAELEQNGIRAEVIDVRSLVPDTKLWKVRRARPPRPDCGGYNLTRSAPAAARLMTGGTRWRNP